MMCVSGAYTKKYFEGVSSYTFSHFYTIQTYYFNSFPEIIGSWRGGGGEPIKSPPSHTPGVCRFI